MKRLTKTLKQSQKIVIAGLTLRAFGSGATRHYLICDEGCGNQQVFTKLGIANAADFVAKVVGYTPKRGAFPEVNSLEDLTKVANALIDLENSMKNTVPVTRESLAKVYEIACHDYKHRIENLLKNNLFTDIIEVPKHEVIEGYSKANPSQQDVIYEHFPFLAEKEPFVPFEITIKVATEGQAAVMYAFAKLTNLEMHEHFGYESKGPLYKGVRYDSPFTNEILEQVKNHSPERRNAWKR